MSRVPMNCLAMALLLACNKPPKSPFLGGVQSSDDGLSSPSKNVGEQRDSDSPDQVQSGGPETNSEPGPKTNSEPGPKTNSEPGPKTNSEPGPKTNSEPGPETNSVFDPEPSKVVEHNYPASFSLTNVKDKCFTVDRSYKLQQKNCNAAEFEGVQTFKAKKLGENKVNFKVITRFTYNIKEYCLGLDQGNAIANALVKADVCNDNAEDQIWKTIEVSKGVFRVASFKKDTLCLSAGQSTLVLQDCKEVETQNLTFLDSTQRRDIAKEADNAPDTIKEDWFEHEETLYKMYEDKDIVIYGDAEWKAKPRESIHQYTRKAWSYFLKRFGNMGGYRLYAVYHGSKKYSGGHPNKYFNSRHHYRNFLDVGAADWPSSGYNEGILNVLVHEMAHIVEDQVFGVRGSPGVVLWGDNKIYEMILYDVYTEMGEISHRDKSAANWRSQNVSTNASGAAKPGTRVDGSGAYWFRDWSLPLLQEFGSEKAIVNFFALMAKYFPHDLTGFTRNFNWGEYCHFMSGAVGKSVKGRMTIAFGWDAKREAEFEQAKKDFPDIKY